MIMTKYTVPIHLRSDKMEIGDHTEILVEVVAGSVEDSIRKALDKIQPILNCSVYDAEALYPEGYKPKCQL